MINRRGIALCARHRKYINFRMLARGFSWRRMFAEWLGVAFNRRQFGATMFLFAATFLWALNIAAPAQAYLDPATGSIMLQILLGSIAGMAAIVKIYWVNIKGFINRRRRRTGNPTGETSG